MESVNLFRPCLPASSAVPIRIRPLWSIRSVENPSSTVQNLRKSLQIIGFSLPSGQGHPIIYCKGHLIPFFSKRWSFSKFQMWWFFPLTLWGETCQCRAKNYQGLDLGLSGDLPDTDDGPGENPQDMEKNKRFPEHYTQKVDMSKAVERDSLISKRLDQKQNFGKSNKNHFMLWNPWEIHGHQVHHHPSCQLLSQKMSPWRSPWM